MKKNILFLCLISILIISCLINCGGDNKSNYESNIGKYKVTYRVLGVCTWIAEVFYINEHNHLTYKIVEVPWDYSFYAAPKTYVSIAVGSPVIDPACYVFSIKKISLFPYILVNDIIVESENIICKLSDPNNDYPDNDKYDPNCIIEIEHIIEYDPNYPN